MYMFLPAPYPDEDLQENVRAVGAWLRLGLYVYVMHSDFKGCVRILGRGIIGTWPAMDTTVPLTDLGRLVDIVGDWRSTSFTHRKVFESTNAGFAILMSDIATDAFTEFMKEQAAGG